MDKCCCQLETKNESLKKVLWIALVLNFSMFLLENFQGYVSQSLSLRADAIDFLGDSTNYFATLFVLNSSIKAKAKVSLTKSLFMFGFGIWVLIEALVRFFDGTIPNSFTMSWVGTLALFINGLVAFLLYRFREGDSNMQSVWLCSRNDAIGNVAVIVASAGVYFLNAKWPDLIVAIIMAFLAISASLKIMLIARSEFQSDISRLP